MRDNESIQCPCCHGTDVIPIIYGCSVAVPDPENEGGRIYLPDKCQDLTDPEWHCNTCGFEWWGTTPVPGCPAIRTDHSSSKPR